MDRATIASKENIGFLYDKNEHTGALLINNYATMIDHTSQENFLKKTFQDACYLIFYHSWSFDILSTRNFPY